MDPPAKINFRPEVDKLDKKMSMMSYEEKVSYDSGIMDDSMCFSHTSTSAASFSASFDGQTQLRPKAEVEEYNSSIGYSSVPFAEPAKAEETRIPSPATVTETREESPLALPENNLFSSVLRQALQDPNVLKPHGLGDAISEASEPTTAPQEEDSQRSVTDGPFQENTHMHNYACGGDSTYLLAPFRSILAEQNEDGDSSLHLAIIHAQIPVVEQVAAVWQGVPEYLNVQNNLGQTGMHLAIITGQPRLVERLLMAGADPCRRDRNGDTCLHLAASYSDKISARAILTTCQHFNLRRQTLEARNYHGFTAAHLCVRRNDREMLKFLVSTWGAEVDAQDFTAGRSPLHLAVEFDLISIASMLLFELKANIDSTMYDNQTPLHIAAGRGNRGMVALLVAAGAQTDVVDGEGEQPADLTYDTQILRLCNA